MARTPKPWYRKDRRVWCVTINGRRHNLGPDKKAAMEQFHALMREPRRTCATTTQLVAIIDEFLDWVSLNRSEATFEWYRCRLQSFVDAHPTLLTCQLRPHHVEKWASVPTHSPTTRRNQLRAVKRCLKWALAQGYVDQDPLAHLEVPSAQSREQYVSPDEFSRILSYVTDNRFADLLVVTYETGCRPQESLRVEARHVDLKHSRWVFRRQESKGKSMPRVVYLSKHATAISAKLQNERPSGPLFCNAKGRPWNKDSVGCAFDRLQIRMGKDELNRIDDPLDERDVARFAETLAKTRVIRGVQVPKSNADLNCEARRKLRQRRARQLAPRYSLYALRHSWATNALQRGVDALTVAILMGHKDPSTLARTYQHLSHNPEHLLAQARKATG